MTRPQIIQTSTAQRASRLDPYEDGMEDYETARTAFEALQVADTFAGNLIDGQKLKPLTASAKRFREMELEMLDYLQDSDETIDPLIEMWMCEREDGAVILQAMERHCSPGLVREERELRDMIDYYGNDWMEPQSRLALLLFTKDKYDEAADWCQNVLRIKPWHFEVGNLLVALKLRQGEFEMAVQAAREYSLPPLNYNTDHKRRRAWVERNMFRAQRLLEQAEMDTDDLLRNEQLEECPVEAIGGEVVDECWE